MRLPVVYASRRQYQHSLPVLRFAFAIIISSFTVGFALGHGFVYRRHLGEVVCNVGGVGVALRAIKPECTKTFV